MKSKKLTLLLIIFLFIISTVTASELDIIGCDEAGILSFNFEAENEKIYVSDVKITAVDSSGNSIDLTNLGKWDTTKRISDTNPGSLFKSNPAVLNKKGRYTIKLNFKAYDQSDRYSEKTQEDVVSCPGFVFSCELLDINLDKCYNENGIFKAEFSFVGGPKEEYPKAKMIDIIKGIDYTLDTEKAYEDIKGNYMLRGSLPKNYKLTNLGNDKYKIEAEMKDNLVKSLRIAFTKDDYYEYTFEIDSCYATVSELKGNLYDFKRCETLSSTEGGAESQITGQAVTEIVQEGKKESSKFNYIILAVIIIILSIITFFIFKKKKSVNPLNRKD